ncbi:MAG: AMIN domain-containing protein [Acidobacteriota bacterium]|nr:AMIN domain-containing protein [Acidobacteriota bacterium]
MKCWNKDCRETEFSDAEPNKVEHYATYVLPLKPVTCDNCERRQYRPADEIFTKERKISNGIIGGLLLLFLVLSIFGGGGDEENPKPAEDDETSVAAGETGAESGEPEQPAEEVVVKEGEPEDLSRNVPPDPEIQVSAFVQRQLERNRARKEGRAPKPVTEPAAPPKPETRPTPTPASDTPSTDSAGNRRLNALRITQDGEDVVLELDGTGSFSDRSQATLGSDRYIIDLKGAWRVAGAVQASYQAPGDLVRRVRIGKHPNYFRMVLDLHSGKSITPAFQEKENGLIIRLSAKRSE